MIYNCWNQPLRVVAVQRVWHLCVSQSDPAGQSNADTESHTASVAA